VGVAVCDRLAAPVLVGVIRPMILLPAAALAGWSPGQLEMILLHELVHVRRGDNLINLLQRVIESALFFHPCVWIVSGWVRREREHCCDAIVVARTGRARAYAETLLALAGTGSDRPPRAAVAMARNDLVSRIRRVLDPNRESHAMKLPRGLLALTAAALMVPAGLSISRAHLAESPLDAGVQAKVEAKEETPQAKPADRPAAIHGKSARREHLMKLRATYADLLKKREALRKLAETVGSDDRQTLALRQQYAMEHLHYLQTELLGVRSQKRKLEAQLNALGPAERIEAPALFEAEVDGLVERHPAVMKLADQLAEQQAKLDADTAELRRVSRNPAKEPTVMNMAKAVKRTQQLLERKRSEVRLEVIRRAQQAFENSPGQKIRPELAMLADLERRLN
jgi:hypothetical protein